MLVLSTVACAAAPVATRPPEPAAPPSAVVFSPDGGFSIGCGTAGETKYSVTGIDSSNPRFGALTYTFVVDGRRSYYGVGG